MFTYFTTPFWTSRESLSLKAEFCSGKNLIILGKITFSQELCKGPTLLPWNNVPTEMKLSTFFPQTTHKKQLHISSANGTIWGRLTFLKLGFTFLQTIIRKKHQATTFSIQPLTVGQRGYTYFFCLWIVFVLPSQFKKTKPFWPCRWKDTKKETFPETSFCFSELPPLSPF